jgi:hypothetical protein
MSAAWSPVSPNSLRRPPGLRGVEPREGFGNLVELFLLDLAFAFDLSEGADDEVYVVTGRADRRARISELGHNRDDLVGVVTDSKKLLGGVG